MRRPNNTNAAANGSDTCLQVTDFIVGFIYRLGCLVVNSAGFGSQIKIKHAFCLLYLYHLRAYYGAFSRLRPSPVLGGAGNQFGLPRGWVCRMPADKTGGIIFPNTG
jgi:hypothetical protein